MSVFVLSLDDPEATLESAGSKGANLGRLFRAGFPVPPGFIITTAAYLTFVRVNDLEAQIAQLPPSEDTPQAIRQLFQHSPIPGPIFDAITRDYDDLRQFVYPQSPPPVAVRSSVAAQTPADANASGHQEAYLNVRGKKALLEAVKHCWSSLWTVQTRTDHAQQDPAPEPDSGPEAEPTALAVVVQRMAPAEAAGVLFTANPQTGNRHEAVIHAAWGLGEAVVGGQVTPDTIVVDKTSGQVTQANIEDKVVMTAPISVGTAALPVPNSQRQKAALTHDQATELARLGREIEAQFGSPQSIEWAIAGGQTIILQSRPLTGLPEAPPMPEDDEQFGMGKNPTKPLTAKLQFLRLLRRLPIFARLIGDQPQTGED